MIYEILWHCITDIGDQEWVSETVTMRLLCCRANSSAYNSYCITTQLCKLA